MEKIILKQRMAIILFFLFILIILLIFGLGIHTSRVGIEVQNLNVDTRLPKGEKIDKEGKVFASLKLFGKIKILRKEVKFDRSKLDIKVFKNKDLNINYKELIKNIEIEKIDLNVQIGTEDAAITAILTGIVSSILGIILRKPKYEVIPVFANKNFIKIKLDGIFSIYLIQNIYKIIFEQIKKQVQNLARANSKKVEV